MVSVGIIGASGYVGGELLRLLLSHPEITSVQAASDSFRGKSVGIIHPHLRDANGLHFIGRTEVQACDVVFLAMSHGSASGQISIWQGVAPITIDLSADFRLKDPKLYEQYYGHPHTAPEFIPSFVSGIPEFSRSEVGAGDYIAGPGCTALAAILAVKPLSQAGVIGRRVFVDAKVGSSGSGSHPALSTHHPLRAGGTRVFKPSGHRHEAEVSAFCGIQAYMTVTSVDSVRGVLVAAYCDLTSPITETELRAIYRACYLNEPFTRLVKRKGNGPFTLPEPRLLTGTNFCDVGFSLTMDGNCVVVFAALDNLTKGAAGNGVHCMNIRFGFAETVGLTSLNSHPL